MASHPDSDVEIERMQLRFAAARVSDERAVRRLMQSIDACGQLVACIAVREGAGEAAPLVLIDGYRRVAALRRLGRDTARVQCCSATVAEALAQLLACAQSRALAAIEQALLLARADRRPAALAARGRTPVRARRELGAAALAAAALAARGRARGSARRQRVVLGGGARIRPVGARQRRARAAAAGRRSQPGDVHARSARLVRPLSARPAPRARSHGRSPAAAHRQRARERAAARGRSPEGRPRGPGGGRARPAASAAGARAQEPGLPAAPDRCAAALCLPPRARAAARTRRRTAKVHR